MTDRSLTELIDAGIIDRANVYQLINEYIVKRRKSKYLDNHKYKLYQGRDGRWFTRFPVKPSGSIQKAFRSKEEAEAAIIGFYEELDETPKIKDVFYAVMDRKYKEGSISESTVTRNTYDFIRFYSDLGEKRIDDVDSYVIEEFIRDQKYLYHLDTKGYSHLLGVTRLIFKYAKKKGLVSFRIDDVISDMDWGKNAFRKEREDSDEVFLDDEVRLLSEYFKSHPTGKHLGLLLCFVTGLRIGELAALKWEDILDDEIIVRRTETNWSDETGFHCEVKNFTKTAAGKRKVPIPTQGLWIIEKLRELNPDGEYVFMLGGERSRTVYFRKAMEKACDAVGIKRRSPHKIRKTYASILLDNNVGEKMIIENMGHTDISTTNLSYARRRRSAKQKVDILSALPEFQAIAK